MMLVSHDGVPIAHAGKGSENQREESLAALAASWLNDVSQAVGPLSWHAPERVCLRAARGTLVLRRSESASLVVLLARDAAPEDVRLSMDGVLARIERARHGRASADGFQPGSASTPAAGDPPGPIPYRNSSSEVEEGVGPAAHPGQSPGI
jgi:predicted regulator of Ras-like GTPase activity (Roadblock/LC7/MglB family)